MRELFRVIPKVFAGLQNQCLEFKLINRVSTGLDYLFPAHPVTGKISVILTNSAVKAVLAAVIGEFYYSVDTAGIAQILLADGIGNLMQALRLPGQAQVGFFQLGK